MLKRKYKFKHNPAARNWVNATKIEMPIVVITVGIPTAGKTTWVEKELKPLGFESVSRDDIREKFYGSYKNIPFTKESENMITSIFQTRLEKLMQEGKDIVLDNTHCKKAYIDAILQKFKNTDYDIRIEFFDIPLWKAYLRNYIRKWKTGKWIPKNVIKQMYENYKKINKNDYDVYKW